MLWKKLMILMLTLSLTACFHAEDDGHDDHEHLQAANGKLEGTVTNVSDTGLSITTEKGDDVTVVIGTDTVTTGMTGVVVGDVVEIQGVFDPTTNTVVATIVSLDNDPEIKEVDMVVGAGLGAPTVELNVSDDQERDGHVEVEGVVSSIAGNAVVVDVIEVEHSTADMGTQLTVMLSADFIKLGAMSDIAVGDEVELKGTLDSNNSFVIRVMKIRAASADDDASDDVDFDNDEHEMLEVEAVVESFVNGVLIVKVTASDDDSDTNMSVAIDTVVTVDTANVQIHDGDLTGINIGDEVELKGNLDAAGNFVVMAVEVENEEKSHNSSMSNNGMTVSAQKVMGVVTAVGADAISLTVTHAVNVSDVMINSNVTIALELGSKFDDGVMPQVGDTVEIDITVVPGVGRVAAEVEVK